MFSDFIKLFGCSVLLNCHDHHGDEPDFGLRSVSPRLIYGDDALTDEVMNSHLSTQNGLQSLLEQGPNLTPGFDHKHTSNYFVTDFSPNDKKWYNLRKRSSSSGNNDKLWDYKDFLPWDTLEKHIKHEDRLVPLKWESDLDAEEKEEYEVHRKINNILAKLRRYENAW